MKKAIVACFALVAFVACNNNAKTEEPAAKKEEAKTTEAAPTMPYTADYSSQFSMGDQKNAEKMLILFKQWDDNKLADGKSMFADSVQFIADSWMFNGTNDSFQVISQRQRDQYKEVRTMIHAWMPVRSTDKNEDWVLVWSRVYNTYKDGKTDSADYQDTWRLNKDGKFDFMLDFRQKPPMPEKK